MFKKIVLSIIIISNMVACSSIHTKNTSTNSHTKYNGAADSDTVLTGRRILALPFYTVGGIAMGLGALAVGAFDSENSESEKQSEAENVLLGLSFMGGGYLLWQIGESIANE